MPRGTKRVALLAGELALAKKATNVKILDLRKLSTVTDYFVICTGDADVHNRAIADWVVEELKKRKIRVWHIEGYDYGQWILLDYIDIVVHIFDESTREYFQLESLWGDASITELTE